MKKVLLALILFIGVYFESLYAQDSMVYLGYGSLIQNPGNLPITGEGFNGKGPKLPIDFLRISGLVYDHVSYDLATALYKGNAAFFPNIRLSVTILPGDLVNSKTQRSDTYFAKVEANVGSDEARVALAKREGTSNIENIAYIKRTNDLFELSEKVSQMSDEDINGIKEWMKIKSIDIVFWAYFDENFRAKMSELQDGMQVIGDISTWSLPNIQLFFNILYYNNWQSLAVSRLYVQMTPENIKANSKFWHEYTGGLEQYMQNIYAIPPSKLNTKIPYSPEPSSYSIH